MLRSAVYTGLRALGVPTLARRLRDAAVVLCYHNVLPPRNAGTGGDSAVHLSFDRFAEQVYWLARRYAIVPLSEIIGRARAGRSLRRVAALTFDDGYAGVFTHAWPLLRDLGLPATVFVVSERPDRRDAFWWDHPDIPRHATGGARDHWLRDLRGDSNNILSALSLLSAQRLPASYEPAGWDAIVGAAREGLDIGVHSATHRTLTRLDDAELEEEIIASRAVVHDRAGSEPTLFAYPYGLWDRRVRNAVRAAGYYGAVTLDYGLIGAGADPWSLRRINIPAAITRAAFQVWVAGLYPRGGTSA